MNELINLGNGQYVKVTMLKGEKGTNIATITKTGTSGLVDTYTVTLTDGSTTTFEVTNGNSIDHVEKTSTVGSVDTYTIYLTDGSSAGTFTVNNAIATVEQNFSTTSENPLMNKTLTNIIAGVENGSTASQTYNKGAYILRNDKLYKVTATVASGTTWSIGVNISEVTIGGELTSINADLTANGNNFYFDYQGGKYGCNTDPNRGAGTFIPFNQLGNLRKVTYSTNTGHKAQGTYDIHYTASQIGLTKVFGVFDDKTRSGNGQIYVTVDSDYSGVTIEYIVYSSGGDTMTTSFKYVGI